MKTKPPKTFDIDEEIMRIYDIQNEPCYGEVNTFLEKISILIMRLQNFTQINASIRIYDNVASVAYNNILWTNIDILTLSSHHNLKRISQELYQLWNEESAKILTYLKTAGE